MTQTMRNIFAAALIVLCTPFCGATCNSQACLIASNNGEGDQRIASDSGCCGHSSCEPRISEAMPCFARAVLTVNEQFFEGVDMAGESDGHVCRIISGS